MAELMIHDAKLIDSKEVTDEGAENVKIRWLISEMDGAPHFQMRLFEIGRGGRTPLHTHEWEHEVYILNGEGKLIFDGGEKPFSRGYFIFVPGGKEHSFINTGSGTLAFLCMVPVRKPTP